MQYEIDRSGIFYAVAFRVNHGGDMWTCSGLLRLSGRPSSYRKRLLKSTWNWSKRRSFCILSTINHTEESEKVGRKNQDGKGVAFLQYLFAGHRDVSFVL